MNSNTIRKKSKKIRKSKSTKSDRALKSKIKEVLNDASEVKYATSTVAGYQVNYDNSALSVMFSGPAIMASMLDLSSYIINAGSGRTNARVGNEIFVKKIKLNMVIYPSLYNDPTSFPHCGEVL